MEFLQYNTANQVILVGPGYSNSGVICTSGVSIPSSGIILHKKGAVTQAAKNCSSGVVFLSNGCYYTILNATDTDTYGDMQITVDLNNYIFPVKHTRVVSNNLYTMNTGTTLQTVDVATVSANVATTADIASGVLNATASSYNSSGTIGNKINNAAAAGLPPSVEEITIGVWGAAAKTITGGTVTYVSSGVTVTTNNDKMGYTVSTVSDKTGYSLASPQSFNNTGTWTGSVTGSVGSVNSGVTVTTNNDKSGYSITGTVTVGTNNDKTGYSLAVTPPTVAQIASGITSNGLPIDQTRIANLDATISSRLASSGIISSVTTVTNPVTVGTNNDKTGYSISSNGIISIASGVLDVPMSSHTVEGSVGAKINSSGSASGTIPSVNEIVTGVWGNDTRTITGGTVDTLNDKTNYTLSASGIISVASGVLDVPITNHLIAGSVGAKINSGGGGTISGTVPTVEEIATEVWGNSTRTITGGIIDVNNDKTNYEVSSTSITSITSGIPNSVWNTSSRTITGNNDKTGYSLASSQTFNLTGNITGSISSVSSGVTVTTNNDKTGYTVSAVSDKTGYSLSAAGVTAINSGIPSSVWSNTSRTITGGTIDTNSDKAGYTLTTAGVDAILDEAIGDSTITMRQLLRMLGASFGGRMVSTIDDVTGSGQIVFYNAADNKAVITATFVSWNRTGVVLDLS